MKAFTELFENLDATTSTNEKIAALKKYFSTSNPKDSMWALLILTSRLSKKSITSKTLRDIFLTSTHYPEWLLDESYDHVGDTAETISLLLQSLELTTHVTPNSDISLSTWLEIEIPKLAAIKDKKEQAQMLMQHWQKLSAPEIFILNKLMTGGFRVGVSEKLVVRALSEVYGVATDQLTHRMTGLSGYDPDFFARLISTDVTEVTSHQPYPFCLANTWGDRSEINWNPQQWDIEWKYDGIRSQIVKRDDQLWIWSRGEDQISKSFPELVEAFSLLPNGSVLDGEILIIKDNKVQAFQDLQKRLGRKKVAPAMLKEMPAGFIAYDCLEFAGEDLRSKPLRERRIQMESLIASLQNKLPKNASSILISKSLHVESLDDLELLRSQSRENDAEGLMLKDWNSVYSVGRKTGAWWKHKVQPLTLDAVLIYAQAGTGRRSNLYTDYTFALWTEDQNKKTLVPFAKAYSGLDQKEIDELDQWIRRHTHEKFGPVRSLEPYHVFEIAFEGIGKSNRHKSGIAVRFPRILRWRKDKKVDDADTLQTAFQLLDVPESHP